MNIEQLLQERFKDIDISKTDLSEIYTNIIETESIKLKILKRIKCKRCGWCCKYQSIMLTLTDIQKLRRYLNCTDKELYDKYMDKRFKIPYIKAPCPFLDKDNRCNIYHIRPCVCKIYPFIDFFLVIDPCLIGKEIFDIMLRDGHFIIQNDEHAQKLYNDRIKMLEYIANTDVSQGIDYKSISIDRYILIKIMQILKNIK